jgi:hypothetical protein
VLGRHPSPTPRDTAQVTSQENIEALKRGFEAVSRLDGEAMLETMDPEEASRRNGDRLRPQLAPNLHQLHQRWPPPLLRDPMPVGHSSEQAVAALLSAKVGLTA